MTFYINIIIRANKFVWSFKRHKTQLAQVDWNQHKKAVWQNSPVCHLDDFQSSWPLIIFLHVIQRSIYCHWHGDQLWCMWLMWLSMMSSIIQTTLFVVIWNLLSKTFNISQSIGMYWLTVQDIQFSTQCSKKYMTFQTVPYPWISAIQTFGSSHVHRYVLCQVLL